LPIVLYCYHDTINETGYSPFSIVYGRHRTGPGIPHPVEKSCEDAEDLFSRLQSLGALIAREMNAAHLAKAKNHNENKVVQPHSIVGDQVLFLKQK
jgi:hypothetical protein